MRVAKATRGLEIVLVKIINIESAESWRLLLLYERESYQITVK